MVRLCDPCEIEPRHFFKSYTLGLSPLLYLVFNSFQASYADEIYNKLCRISLLIEFNSHERTKLFARSQQLYIVPNGGFGDFQVLSMNPNLLSTPNAIDIAQLQDV